MKKAFETATNVYQPKLGKTPEKVAMFATMIILLLFAVFTLAPFYFMLVSSFKSGTELVRNGINMNVNSAVMSLKNYELLFFGKDGIYLHWYINSTLITLIQTVVAVSLSAFVGYGLAIYRFRGRNLIFVIVLVMMMVPIEILMLPLYQFTVNLKIIDTYAGVILPFAIPPVAVFFFRQFCVGLPKDLIDAARIDGCTEYGIYFKVMMPLMRPAFGAMIILQALFSWNNFVWPLIALRSSEKLTLPIGLASLITPYGNNYDMLMPGAVISVVPIIIVFLFFQKSFIAGLTIGAVKE